MTVKCFFSQESPGSHILFCNSVPKGNTLECCPSAQNTAKLPLTANDNRVFKDHIREAVKSRQDSLYTPAACECNTDFFSKMSLQVQNVLGCSICTHPHAL